MSLIVPARNEEKVIGKCLKSILSLSYPKEKMEIIVAIDGSNDKTEKISKSFGKRVRVINSCPKKCKGDAINNVLPKCKGKIIGIYDADCIVDKNCLKEAVRHFEDDNVAGVCGNLKSHNKNQSLVARSLSLETNFISFFEYFLNGLGANSHFSGKNMFIRKDVLKKVGGFDTLTFIEDIEMSLKLKDKGYRTVFEPNAIAWNEEPVSVSSFVKQRMRWARGSIRMLKYKRRKGKKLLSDLMHGVYFYTPPFGLITATVLAIFLYFGLPLFLTAPVLGLFIFTMSLIVLSRIKMKEPLRDLAYLPVWFILSNIQLVLIFKAIIDEKLGKGISWNSVRALP
ncbi:MAG: glycosyltransferase [Candidatus Aenigmarchaeota archaeon]|nr:glycosyltransferase [Candidatus Aenigmarchaeota archaeon]